MTHAWFNNGPQEKLKRRSVLLTGCGRGQGYSLRSHTGKTRWRTKKEKGRTWGYIYFFGFMRRVPQSFRLRPNWSIQTNKGGVLISSKGFLRKECQVEYLGRWRGNYWPEGLLGNSYQRLTLFATLQVVVYILNLYATASVSSRTPQSTWSKKWMWKQPYMKELS